MTTLRLWLTLPLLLAAFASGCANAPGSHSNGLAGDGSVASPCDDKVCDGGRHCELRVPPCAPDSPACEPVAVCVDDDVSEDCGGVTCALHERCAWVPTPCAPGQGVCEAQVCVLDVERLCAQQVCPSGTRCEPLAEPCGGDDGACALYVHCVDDEPAPCTPDDCGPQPPTLPCADESPSQACDREETGECGWRQLACPHVGEPCTGCEPCPIPEFGECQWTEIGVCSQVSASCV